MEDSRPAAVFMVFGTKGDVYPIAAIAAAFSRDQKQYYVALITHSAHENLNQFLIEKGVSCFPISSPPALSPQDNDLTDLPVLSSSSKKRIILTEHRAECFAAISKILGHRKQMDGDFIAINFFALEGWSFAEYFGVPCTILAPYVVPYSAPSSFERQFMKEHPMLYEYLQQAPPSKVSWDDVIHWMWPLFSEEWSAWRATLNLSPCPFTDPVTGLPTWHERLPSPSVLYGFSKEVVECPEYWPPSVRVCGFWFLPNEWQMSHDKRKESSLLPSRIHDEENCGLPYVKLQNFISCAGSHMIFIGLSSIGSLGFLRNPLSFLRVLKALANIMDFRFLLFSAGYAPLRTAVQEVAHEEHGHGDLSMNQYDDDEIFLFGDRLFCFSGSVPYNWLFRRCAAVVHHGGSGSTAAALCAGVPQVICPFILDQFYWAERMYWLGVSPQPIEREHLIPDRDDSAVIEEAANSLSLSLNFALSPDVRNRARKIAERLSREDGVSKAVAIIKETVCFQPVSSI